MVHPTGPNSKEDEIKGESAMLQLLVDYVNAENYLQFMFVEGDETTKSAEGLWLVKSLILSSS